ncbi:hypothetical protein AVEN_91759-1 [Araneus ventricosus]|uniref:Uncharacterized protein n=1 Tax=Araneus ventricosus TaxID=182803 RepID=A0A4Y2HUM9_ARAVE|nr:hypothetical protein AVEN_91759-1 [Araneus ventricosus]
MLHVNSYVGVKHPPLGVVRKFGEWVLKGPPHKCRSIFVDNSGHSSKKPSEWHVILNVCGFEFIEEIVRNTVSTTFSAECDILDFFVTGKLEFFHDIGVWGKAVHPYLIIFDDPEKKVRDEEVRQAVKILRRK